MLGYSLFFSVSALVTLKVWTARKCSKTLQNILATIERRIQRDEGKRGLSSILLPTGELFKAALELCLSSNITIVTGFPCLLDYDVPTETDGPPGAIALAKAALLLNKNVNVLTDECNEESLLACASAIDVPFETRCRLRLESFPSDSDEIELNRLCEIYEETDLLIAIERTGPNFEGKYLTMRARDMTHLIAPLDIPLRGTDPVNFKFIGIGN
jgi:D-glutamate cyclase